MTVYRHDAGSLAGDYGAAAAGIALTAAPLALVPVAPGIGWVLGIACAGFALYALRTAVVHLGPVDVDETGIARGGPMKRRIAWDRLSGLRLRYFSTRRDGRRGWMQLVLRGEGARLRIESTLPGFDDIVCRAARAAAAAGIAPDPATRANLERLGIRSTDKEQQSATPDAGFVER